jgi:hypothetical protein
LEIVKRGIFLSFYTENSKNFQKQIQFQKL